jgi:hypothetical protein
MTRRAGGKGEVSGLMPRCCAARFSLGALPQAPPAVADLWTPHGSKHSARTPRRQQVGTCARSSHQDTDPLPLAAGPRLAHFSAHIDFRLLEAEAFRLQSLSKQRETGQSAGCARMNARPGKWQVALPPSSLRSSRGSNGS